MRVAELIELLRTLPPDLHVVVNGYEQGYNDISSCSQVTIRKLWQDPDQENRIFWEGQYDDSFNNEPCWYDVRFGEDSSEFSALLLSRYKRESA